MFEQQSTRLIRPLHVVEQHHERHRAAQSLGQFQHRVEQVALLLLRWHFLRRWNVREPPTQIRKHQGDLPCGRAQDVTQVAGWYGAHQLLEDLGAGDERCTVFLVGVPGQRQHAACVPQGQRLLAQPSLAGAGLAADQHHATAALSCFLEAAIKQRHFLVATDQRRGLRTQQVKLTGVDGFGVAVAERVGCAFVHGARFFQAVRSNVENPGQHQHQRKTQG